jgi:hypothetical protein
VPEFRIAAKLTREYTAGIALSCLLAMALVSCSDDRATEPIAAPETGDDVTEPDTLSAASPEPVVNAPRSSLFYARVGDVSKRRIVVAPDQQPVFEIEARGAGTLHLAAGLPADSELDAAEVATCQVRFDDGTAPSLIATLPLQGGQTTWSEHVVELPARSAGRLTFACRNLSSQPVDAVWAEPLFSAKATGKQAPAVILISLDTLRADHVTGFGAQEDLTPALARLGREGQRYVDTTAESAWTLPSHFSLFYSRLYGFPPVGSEVVGLAQALSDQGFVTAGLTGGGFVGATFRFQIGFDHYAEYLPELGKQSDIDLLPDILNDGRDWLDRFANEPLFLFLHTYAVHEITADEADWYSDHGLLRVFEPTPTQVEDVRAFYSQLVRKTDDLLDPFFDDLRRIAKKRPVTVVIVSDHGEAFGEHDNFRHGLNGPTVTLHDEVTRVPLIVWGPGRVAPGLTFDRPTMLSDVAPSILASLGLPVPASMLGESLAPMWSGDVTTSAHNKGSVSQVDQIWSLRDAKSKLIMALEPDGSERFELYDLARDPKERSNLAMDDASAAVPIKKDLETRLADFGVRAEPGAPIIPPCTFCGWLEIGTFWNLIDPPAAELSDQQTQEGIDEATQQRLRALGYIQ